MHSVHFFRFSLSYVIDGGLMFLVSQLGLTDENFKKNTLSLSWQCSETGQCPQVLVSSKIGTSIEVVPAPTPWQVVGRVERKLVQPRTALLLIDRTKVFYSTTIMCGSCVGQGSIWETLGHCETLGTLRKTRTLRNTEKNETTSPSTKPIQERPLWEPTRKGQRMRKDEASLTQKGISLKQELPQSRMALCLLHPRNHHQHSAACHL